MASSLFRRAKKAKGGPYFVVQLRKVVAFFHSVVADGSRGMVSHQYMVVQ